jgi:hypothetical protein
MKIAKRSKKMSGPSAARPSVVGAAQSQDVLPLPHIDTRFLTEFAPHGGKCILACLDLSPDAVESAGLPRWATLADQQDVRAIRAE